MTAHERFDHRRSDEDGAGVGRRAGQWRFDELGVQMNVPDANSDDSGSAALCSINYDPTHTSCNGAARVPYLTSDLPTVRPRLPRCLVGCVTSFDGELWTSTATPSVVDIGD